MPRWGEKSASAVLGAYAKLEAIPDDAKAWKVKPRGAEALGVSLAGHRPEAALSRTLATLRTDVPLHETLTDLAWRGADRALLGALLEEIEDSSFMARVTRFR